MRGVGLKVAGGDVVAYLDDDNRFHPHWFKALVATFKARPDRRWCYGARVVDDDGRLWHRAPSARRWIHYEPWSSEAIKTYNLADMNVIAHRPCAARFDESLAHHGDWEPLLQLAAESDPVEVPAIGTYYGTDARDRRPAGSNGPRDRAVIRRKAAGP